MERVGRYEILAELGRGATGQVYRARDPEIDRLVAVKVLTPSAGADPQEVQAWRERFRREARAAGRLTHPNIVAIHDVGTFEDGVDLSTLLHLRPVFDGGKRPKPGEPRRMGARSV